MYLIFTYYCALAHTRESLHEQKIYGWFNFHPQSENRVISIDLLPSNQTVYKIHLLNSFDFISYFFIIFSFIRISYSYFLFSAQRLEYFLLQTSNHICIKNEQETFFEHFHPNISNTFIRTSYSIPIKFGQFFSFCCFHSKLSIASRNPINKQLNFNMIRWHLFRSYTITTKKYRKVPNHSFSD